MMKIKSKNNFAFTLAEVLITLGIIGVVASITVPILMNSIQDAQFKTAYRKAYSVASQALVSANQQNLLLPSSCVRGNCDSSNGGNFLAFMAQFKTTKECLNNDYENCWSDSGEKWGLSWNPEGYPNHTSPIYAFIDSSGMAWCLYYKQNFIVFVDTNGFKKPNQWGKDRFILYPAASDGTQLGIPVKISAYYGDNNTSCCDGNKCGTPGNPDYQKYFGASWLYN